MSDPQSRRSFSPASRLQIGLDKVLRTVLMVAVIVMLNYLGTQFFHRFYVNNRTKIELSSRTLSILRSVTNEMTITLYYDTSDQENFYGTLKSLADEYHAANPRITIRTVDYERDPGEAGKIKAQYDLPGASDSPNAPPSKDLVIFACGDRHSYVPGEAIVKYQLEQTAPDDPHQKELQFRKKPIAFNGELMFTSRILALANKEPVKAYFLEGHGEASLTDTSDGGYAKFAMTLAQNNMAVNGLQLYGDTGIPADCSLLIIAGPIKPLDETELKKINEYLSQGGRLLVLFNYESLKYPTGIGLDMLLQKWGITAVPSYIQDPPMAVGNYALMVRNFNAKSFLNPLASLALEMALPRPVEAQATDSAPPSTPGSPNTPDAQDLAFTSEKSILASDPGTTRSYPIISAVDKKPVAGIANTRGNTRIVVAGDSMFLDNQLIEAGANRDFLNYAASWLTDRQELLTGVSSRPITEFRLMITQQQSRQLDWLLLGALPGSFLVLGWLVWLVRRK